MCVVTVAWTALAEALTGDLVLPSSPAYPSVRDGAIARFHDVRPAAVARCASPADVAATIAFARRAGVPIAVRSGGHCFAGRSSTTGVVIDVRPMRAIAVGDGLVETGAGARLGELYDALAEHGRTIAAGCGPAVGVAGLVLGGGLGLLGRRHGLTSDQLVAAQVVLADGRVVDANEDLLWGLRGAGGGQFGVVTALTLRTVPAPAATSLRLAWRFEHAAKVLAAWQDWAPDAPEELAASLLVTAAGDGGEPPAVTLLGTMLATEAETARRLEELKARVGASPASASLRHGAYRTIKRELAEEGADDEASGHAFSKSEFFRGPLPAAAIAALLEHLVAERPSGEVRQLDLTPWGGAYNRVPEGATAFAHRAERFLLKHEVVADPAATAGARRWLQRSWELAHPWGSGCAYPNFPDPELEDWLRACHGANLERLLELKAAVDPDGVFAFPGSLAGGTTGQSTPQNGPRSPTSRKNAAAAAGSRRV
jgi:FAD/FMN-containing dehydrogenase